MKPISFFSAPSTSPVLEDDSDIGVAFTVPRQVLAIAVAAVVATASLGAYLNGNEEVVSTPVSVALEEDNISFFYPTAAKPQQFAFQLEDELPPTATLAYEDDPVWATPHLVLAVRAPAPAEDELPIAAIAPFVADEDATAGGVTSRFARFVLPQAQEDEFVAASAPPNAVFEDDVAFPLFLNSFALPVHALLLEQDAVPAQPQTICVAEDPDWTYQQYPPTAMPRVRALWNIIQEDSLPHAQGVVPDDEFYCTYIAAQWYANRAVFWLLDDGSYVAVGPRQSLGLGVNDLSGVRYVVLSTGEVRYTFGRTSALRYAVQSTSAPRYKVDNTSAPRYTVKETT